MVLVLGKRIRKIWQSSIDKQEVRPAPPGRRRAVRCLAGAVSDDCPWVCSDCGGGAGDRRRRLGGDERTQTAMAKRTDDTDRPGEVMGTSDHVDWVRYDRPGLVLDLGHLRRPRDSRSIADIRRRGVSSVRGSA